MRLLFEYLYFSKDKRIWVYTREQLEKGETHDVMWNAAQIQAVREGKMHNYMRMYWCKKILEWTASPEQALEYAIWLNDTFNLDGTDPNGYVGKTHNEQNLWSERSSYGDLFTRTRWLAGIVVNNVNYQYLNRLKYVPSNNYILDR